MGGHKAELEKIDSLKSPNMSQNIAEISDVEKSLVSEVASNLGHISD